MRLGFSTSRMKPTHSAFVHESGETCTLGTSSSLAAAAAAPAAALSVAMVVVVAGAAADSSANAAVEAAFQVTKLAGVRATLGWTAALGRPERLFIIKAQPLSVRCRFDRSASSLEGASVVGS